MQRLILLRHGRAAPDSPSGDDFDRPLTPAGQRDAAAIGARLAEAGLGPDLALVSTAVRARETWAAAQASFPSAQTRLEPRLYQAGPDEILALAREAGREVEAVAVVGHNPTLQELAVRLMATGAAPASALGQASRDFPAAAAAVFQLDPEGRAELEGLFYPDLRG